MTHIFSSFRTAFGLSLLFLWPLSAGAQQLTSADLQSVQAPAGIVIEVSAQQAARLQRVGDWPQSETFPLGQMGEVFSALLAAQALQNGTLVLDEVVNDRLEALRLVPGAAGAEIRLRHVLTRSSGLAWREAGFYQSLGSKVPPLGTLLVQEVRPAVLPPGQAITANSAAELVLAQLLTETSALTYPQLLKQRLLDPLGLRETRLAQEQDYAGGHAAGSPFPLLQPSAPDLHGWKSTPGDIGRLLEALVGQKPQALPDTVLKPLLTRQLMLPDGGPSASLGLLETQVAGETLFYLDSQAFGYTQRLALWPAQQRALYVAYNASQGNTSPVLSAKLTRDWVQTFQTGPATPGSSAPVSPPGLVRADRDPHSLIKALNLLQPQTPAADTVLLAPAADSSAAEALWREAGGGHASYRRARIGEQPALQGVLALLWAVLALSVLWRGSRFLYNYTPVLTPEPSEDAVIAAAQPAEQPTMSAAEARFQIEAPAPESADTPDATWGLPLLASLSSGLMLLFTLGFGPVLLWSGRVGDQLSLVVRNQPSGWLLAWLVMPLATLLSALMLLALLSTEWRERTRAEAWHYGGFGLSVLLWAAWINSWNLLGFRF